MSHNYRRVRSSTSHSIPSLARTAAASRQWLTYREWVTIVTWVPETQKGEEVEISSGTYRLPKSKSPLAQHPQRPRLNISPKVLSLYLYLYKFFFANNLNIYYKTTDSCTSPDQYEPYYSDLQVVCLLCDSSLHHSEAVMLIPSSLTLSLNLGLADGNGKIFGLWLLWHLEGNTVHQLVLQEHHCNTHTHTQTHTEIDLI